MPVRPENVSELNYDVRDLFLDVRLTSIGINDSINRSESGFIENNDFTGRPTFKTEFFRDSTGFGITNIKISTNASLQPTLDIEFKDLYGKTVFGELSGVDNLDVSYKALFQWPPPKFEFTYKGYLGKPVTWILNMKTTSTQYNSDDGSYTIKATFIPNQWGMFADIPFLYLFAVKGLKAQNLPANIRQDTPEYKERTESIIDFMYIGKKLQTLKKQASKEYDAIVGDLQAFKSDPVNGIITGRIPIASLDPEGEVPKLIKSGVPGRGEIDGFKNLAIVLPDNYKGKSNEELELYLKDIPVAGRASENARIKAATWRAGDFSKKDPLSKAGGKYQKVEGKVGSGTIESKVRSDAKSLDGIIEQNLELIETQIKGSLYNEFQDELEKTTISAIFNRIAKDTAYIMGFILDAGEQGYFNNVDARVEKEKKNEIIGQYFPMEFIEIENKRANDPQEKVKKQVPAEGLGTDEFEKLFVSNFISAMAFGIAQNRALQAAAGSEQQNAIKFRVNNIEIISDNPFLNITDWKQIASIIMKRAGIAGYLTKNTDPNKPGYWPDEWFFSLNPEKMRKMADNDISNITDDVLLQLEPPDLQKLKEFCTFWLNAISDADGANTGQDSAGKGSQKNTFQASKWRGGNASDSGSGPLSLNRQIFVLNPGNKEVVTNGAAKVIMETIEKNWDRDNRILPYSARVALENFGIIDKKRNSIDKSNTNYVAMKDAGFEAYTFEEYLEQFIGPNYLFNGRSTRQAIDGTPIVRPSLLATSSFYTTLAPFVNYNGLSFAHVSDVTNDNVFEFVWFRDEQDVSRIGELQPVQGTSDGENQNKDEEEKNEETVDLEPVGVFVIDSPTYLVDPEEPENSSSFWGTPNKQPNPGIQFSRDIPEDQNLGYNWCKGANTLSDIAPTLTRSGTIKDAGGEGILYIDFSDMLRSDMKRDFLPTNNEGRTISLFGGSIDFLNPTTNPTAFICYAMTWDVSSGTNNPALGLFGVSDMAYACRSFLRKFCSNLYGRIDEVQNETSEIFGQILGRAGEHEDLIYQQFHTLFHQWQILGSIGNKRINSPAPSTLTANAALKLEEIYGATGKGEGNCGQADSIADDKEIVNFRYDYPLQSQINPDGKPAIDVADSVINIDPLYNAKANTTVLNIFQQVCTKNNFMFFPIPGNSRYKCIEDIFRPVTTVRNPKIGNFFQILFNPTPESRTLDANSDEAKSLKDDPKDFTVQAFPVKFGDPSNKIVRNVTVSTDENKVTAESIVNLQKIVDNEDNSRTVTTDCSLLSVFEGRSYKCRVETIGNAQISPMQFFYLENHTIFTGLYQIIKVDHTISPNNMTTEFEGIKMRFAAGSYGGIVPVTLADFREAAGATKQAPLEEKAQTAAEAQAQKDYLDNIRPISSGPSGIVGTGEGSKQVSSYLREGTQTRTNIERLIDESVKVGITNPKMIAGILSIVSKESGFVLKFENLYYSLERAYEVWPRLKNVDTSKAFNPTTKKADTESYRKELAKLVYGKTYGNDGYTSKPGRSDHKILQKFVGPYTDGYDGYRYRGGGYNQITFKSAYKKVKEASGIDVLTNPELIIKSPTSEQSCIAFFKRRIEGFPASKWKEWGATNGNSLSVSFSKISDAVFYAYHCNTGTGKSVAEVKALNSPNHKLGGMQKAQARAPYLLEFVEKYLNLPISKDGQGSASTPSSSTPGTFNSNAGGSLPYTGPSPNADKLRNKLKELGYKEKGREISNGGDISNEITEAMIAILQDIKDKHPSYAVTLTGGNDEYHQKLSYNSRHKSGYAMDFVVSPSKNPKDLDNIVLILESFKKKYNPKGVYIDEYRRPSSAATAGHFHVQIN